VRRVAEAAGPPGKRVALLDLAAVAVAWAEAIEDVERLPPPEDWSDRKA
jgi:hypothetical protein